MKGRTECTSLAETTWWPGYLGFNLYVRRRICLRRELNCLPSGSVGELCVKGEVDNIGTGTERGKYVCGGWVGRGGSVCVRRGRGDVVRSGGKVFRSFKLKSVLLFFGGGGLFCFFK